MLLSVLQQDQVHTHLEVVIGSPLFNTSARRGQLLRYLVERALAGEGSRISEYAIGVDVLGRPETFDPRIESIVRTEMGRLRQKLKEYYSQAGEDSRVVIELPLRSYAPRFVFREMGGLEVESRGTGAVTPLIPVTGEESGGQGVRTYSRPRRAVLFAVGIILVAAPLALWQMRHPFFGGRRTPETTRSPLAHQLFMEGASTGAKATPEAYRKAIALFHDALQKDPSYAAAYLNVAKDEQGLILLMAQSPKQGTGEMEAALRKALDIDPELGEARGLLAELRSIRDWDWPSAEREYQQAIDEGAPAFVHMMYGWGLATRGRFAESHAQLRLAQDLEPLSLDARFFEALAYYIEHRFTEAKKLARDILTLDAGYLPGHGLLAMLAVLERNCGEAVPQVEWFARQPAMPVTKVLLAWESACRGEHERAESYLEQAGRTAGSGYASPYLIASAYALLDKNVNALDYLEKSAADHEPQILYLKYAPEFTEIREDPRYLTLERRVGLDP
jgi:tetratricopeptide (TPR) repeat protein